MTLGRAALVRGACGVHIRSGDTGEADTLTRNNGEADHS